MEAIRSVLLLGLISPFLLLINTIEAATFTFSNNCQYNVWPATLTGGGPQLSTTGFELASGESNSVDVPRPWSGRVWGRSLCSTEASGRFFCQTADCSSGKVECDGAGGVPPASLAELTLADSTDEHDTYDISLVDGFNLPISLTPQGGAGDCSTASCPANINSVCPPELSVKGTDGGVIECKSACAAFNKPEYCCTEQYGESGTCYATNYSKIFKDQCPQAYSFAYNDNSSTFTCAGGPNYLVTFCP